jgi:hypothetical protein
VKIWLGLLACLSRLETSDFYFPCCLVLFHLLKGAEVLAIRDRPTGLSLPTFLIQSLRALRLHIYLGGFNFSFLSGLDFLGQSIFFLLILSVTTRL